MNRFKEIREMRGLSQKFVALSLGVKAPSVYEWETGKSYPSITNLVALADLFMVSVDELLGRAAQIEAPQYSPDELRLVSDYRALSAQGQEIIRQQMYMAGQIYKKQSSDLPRVEAQG